MIRKKLCAFALLVLASVAFAQTAPKKILTSRDIDTFIAEYEGIEADLSALNGNYDDYFADTALVDSEGSPVSPDAIRSSIAKLRATQLPSEVVAVFKNHGLGDNGFEKYVVIGYGTAIMYFDEAMKEQFAAAGDDPETQAYVDQANVTVDAMRSCLHADDLSLVSLRYAELSSVLESSDE